MDSKFTKSKRNKGTEKEGLAVLLTDPHFQAVDTPTKRRILELVGKSDAFGIQTFDAIMTTEPVPPIDASNIEEHFEGLKLIEMKTTRMPIRGEALSGFFFGATEREYAMAKVLGDRYLFAFVVLNADNDYGRPFAVLLPLEEVERRTLKARVQYQVNFRTDLADTLDPGKHHVVVFGLDEHIPSSEE